MTRSHDYTTTPIAAIDTSEFDSSPLDTGVTATEEQEQQERNLEVSRQQRSNHADDGTQNAYLSAGNHQQFAASFEGGSNQQEESESSVTGQRVQQYNYSEQDADLGESTTTPTRRVPVAPPIDVHEVSFHTPTSPSPPPPPLPFISHNTQKPQKRQQNENTNTPKRAISDAVLRHSRDDSILSENTSVHSRTSSITSTTTPTHQKRSSGLSKSSSTPNASKDIKPHRHRSTQEVIRKRKQNSHSNRRCCGVVPVPRCVTRFTALFRSLSCWFCLFVCAGAALPALILCIWLPLFLSQSVNLSETVRLSNANSAHQIVHNSMKLPRTYLHGFSSYTDTETVTFGSSISERERMWNVIWNSFSKSMYEWSFHVHYTYFFAPQSPSDSPRSLGVMGGSWAKHQIKPEYRIPPPSGTPPEHNAGFDHSKILRYHSGWGGSSSGEHGYLIGENVLNATSGEVSSWVTLNVTYGGETKRFNDITNAPSKTGWLTSALWHCEDVKQECMQMTGYFEKELDSSGDVRGYHYIAYETTGFSKEFTDLHKNGYGFTFMIEKSTKNLLAVGDGGKLYYEDSDGTMKIHSINTYPNDLVNAAGNHAYTSTDLSIVNRLQSSTIYHNAKTYNVDITFYKDGHGIEWFLVTVTDSFMATSVPITLGTVFGAVTVGFIFLFVCCGCFMTLSIRRYIHIIIHNLHHIERMRLEEVKVRSKPFLTEFTHIMTALYHLKQRMVHYRAFLPSQILDTESSSSTSELQHMVDQDILSIASSDDETQSQVSDAVMNSSFEKTKAGASGLVKSSVQRVLGSRSADLDQLGQKMGFMQKRSFLGNSPEGSSKHMDPRFECNLQLKEMTLLVVEIHNVDIVLECLDWSSFTFQHGEYLSTITKISSTHKGSLDYFSHRHFCYQFKSPVLAAKAALKLEKRFNQLNNLGAEEDHSNVPFYFSIGISTHGTFTGTLGNQQMKRKVIFGEGKKIAESLSKANRTYDTSILCCPRTRDAIKDIIQTRPVTQIQVPHSYSMIDAHEVVELILHVSDEWMYEIENQERIQKRFVVYKKGYREFMKQNYAAALKHFMEFYQNNPTDRVVAKMIKKCTAQMVQQKGLSNGHKNS